MFCPQDHHSGPAHQKRNPSCLAPPDSGAEKGRPATGGDAGWAQAPPKCAFLGIHSCCPPVLPGGEAVTHLRLERMQFLSLASKPNLKARWLMAARAQFASAPSRPAGCFTLASPPDCGTARPKFRLERVPPPNPRLSTPLPLRMGKCLPAAWPPHTGPKGLQGANRPKQGGKYQSLTWGNYP